ncbi:MAG: T9SS type A sorting domain-containing protein [Saprospiraceae bacterium]|nr:T9SS type A sorting domain-containing protein [Candidatus Vicinibacter proximus]
MFKFLIVEHFVYNSTSAPSGHKKNDFFRLKFGDQAQKDNSGLFITCNSFLEQKQAWFITGNFQDQGFCDQFGSWTPDNQFKDGADQNNPENHIKSFTSFDYWLPSFTQQYRPIYNTSSVVNVDVCTEGRILSGCDPWGPVNDTTVATRQGEYNRMGDGMERRMLGNELLRYYGKTDDTANFKSLIATMTDEPTKRSYALVLVNDGNLTGAQAVVNTLNGSDPENQDFNKLYSVVRYQKMNDYGLDELNETQVLTLDSISLNRTQAAYMAQGILSYYYGYEFLIPIEFPDTTLEYRSRKEKIENKDRNPNTLYLAPNPVHESVDISLSQYNLINPEIQILDGQGRLVYTQRISNSHSTVSIGLRELNPSLYFVILRDQGMIVSKSKFIKY